MYYTIHDYMYMYYTSELIIDYISIGFECTCTCVHVYVYMYIRHCTHACIVYKVLLYY